MKKRLSLFLFSLMITFSITTPLNVYAQELSVQSNRSYSYYKVVSGDSLSLIALKYNTSVNLIKSLNGLSSNTIYVGRTLKVPSKANVSVLNYTVKAGDTLWTISSKTGTPVGTIKAANGMKSNYLYAGRILKITFRNPSTTVNYRVKSGETPWTLAQKYGT